MKILELIFRWIIMNILLSETVFKVPCFTVVLKSFNTIAEFMIYWPFLRECE